MTCNRFHSQFTAKRSQTEGPDCNPNLSHQPYRHGWTTGYSFLHQFPRPVTTHPFFITPSSSIPHHRFPPLKAQLRFSATESIRRPHPTPSDQGWSPPTLNTLVLRESPMIFLSLAFGHGDELRSHVGPAHTPPMSSQHSSFGSFCSFLSPGLSLISRQPFEVYGYGYSQYYHHRTVSAY